MEILSLNLNRSEPEPTAAELRFQVALIASASAIAVALVERFVFDAPLIPELMAQLIFAVAPIWAVEIAVGLLGPFAKHLAFLACVVGFGGALMGAAILCLRLNDEQGTRVVAPARIGTFSSMAFLVTL